MADRGRWRYRRSEGVLVSMHAKERVIVPVLRQGLGLRVTLAAGVDTDRFGTFSRDVARRGTPLDAARAKIAAGFERAPAARVGIASEGSFGPHPQVPFVPIGRELVVMVDRDTGLEVHGHDASLETNFAHRICRDADEAAAFARAAGFPEHGVIVMGCRGERPAPDLLLRKDIATIEALRGTVRRAIADSGQAFVETDMRAHRNPTRMAAIERATRDLVRRFRSRCPACGQPGFDVTQRIAGLACAWCGAPTAELLAEIVACGACGHRIERPAASARLADPAQCQACNP